MKVTKRMIVWRYNGGVRRGGFRMERLFARGNFFFLFVVVD